MKHVAATILGCLISIIFAFLAYAGLMTALSLADTWQAALGLAGLFTALPAFFSCLSAKGAWEQAVKAAKQFKQEIN